MNFDDNHYNKENSSSNHLNDDVTTPSAQDSNQQQPEAANNYEEAVHSTVASTASTKPRKHSVWSLLVSGLVGGLTVAVISFFLLSNGMIDINVPNSNNDATTKTESTVETDNLNDNQATTTTTAVSTISTEEEQSLANAIQQVSDAVVGVTNIQQTGLWSPTNEQGTGSGVIYKKEDEKAYVVTNNHVVDGANEVEVILSTGDHLEAEILGTDELTDLAVLEIDGSEVTQVASLGSSSSLTVGDTAIAIGNPLGKEFAGTVTKGIISGVERSVEMDLNGDMRPDWSTEVIQTDAAINPGNSGGALVNRAGELIGINSMKIAQEAVEGIGFAIPIDAAKPIIEQLETDGSVSRPFVGISAVNLSSVPTMNKQQTLQLDESINDGVVIADVQKDSPADKAGIQQYDVITKLNDHEVETMMDFRQYLYSETNIGDQVNLTYYREGQQRTTSIVLTDQ